DRLARHLAVRRQILQPQPAPEQALQRARVDDRAGEEVRARLLALLEQRDRHLAEPLRDVGVLLEELAEPDRAGEPRRPGADDEDADLDPLVRRVGRLGDELRGVERRREVGGFAHEPRRCAMSSVSFGTISWTSPTTPRSLNSKIGAFASLLIATIVPELCMPTLCWIAPEMPSAK